MLQLVRAWPGHWTSLHRVRLPILLILVILAVAGFGDEWFRSTPHLVDEANHVQRVLRVRGGDFRPDARQTNLPGYYTLLAGLSWATGSESLADLRRLALCLSMLGVPLVYRLRRILDPNDEGLTAAQYVFLPFLLPFCFLVYVDPFALVLTLLSLLLILEDRPAWAAVAAGIGVLVRQPQIAWTVFFFLLLYAEQYGLQFDRRRVLRHLRRTWLFLVVFVAFGLFLACNRGVALGDRDMHPFPALHSENIFLALFLCGVAFLPLHVANLPRIFTLLGQRPCWLLVVAATLCLYWLTFCGDHPYNQACADIFLRNALLGWIRAVFMRQ